MAVVSKRGFSTIVDLSFIGYYQEKQIQNMGEVDGVYAAFACTLSNDKSGKEYCTPLRCIYIGKATGTDNVKVRVNKHMADDHTTWKSHLNEGEHILYAYSECSSDLVEDVEAALIFGNQPTENVVGKSKYIGKTSFLTVNLSGNFGSLGRTITVW